MNQVQRKSLQTPTLLSLVFSFIVSAAMMTTVAAKSAPTKNQPKPQTSKSTAKANQKLDSKVRPATTQRSGARNPQGENVSPRRVLDNRLDLSQSSLNSSKTNKNAAAHRNVKEKTSGAESRQTRNEARPSASRKSQRAAEQRAAEARRTEARRQAEANRLAAIARQRATDQELRDDVQAMIARDNTAGEDMEVRAAAVKALGNHAGTVVVMDPKTGRVYSMVNQEWAVSRGFKPCSTIKLVTGMAGLNEGVIDQSGMEQVGGASNHQNLTKALAYSQNEYFQQVGGRIGLEKMISYSHQLGLGEKTGINFANESRGQIPSLRSGPSGRIFSHGDDYKVTPLQLATLVSAMANGGKLLTPRVINNSREDASFKPKVRRVVNISSTTLASMIPGMVGAVNYGSGRKAHHSGANVAGKTGTCIEQGTWVGLFASYAPTVNPRLAVVVIGRGPDARGHFPAAVAGRIYRDLNGRFGTPTYMQVASNPASRKIVDEEEVNDEELEEERYNKANSSGRKTSAMQTRATESIETFHPSETANSISNNKVRRVLMTIPTMPVVPTKVMETRPAPSQTRPRRVSQL